MIDTATAIELPECLASRPGYLLNRASRQLNDLVEQTLEPLGIRSRHFSVLAVLSSTGPVSQQRLTEILLIDRTTMVGIVDDLERMGYVERRRHPADRRAYQLYLTDEGRTAQERFQGEVDTAASSFFGCLSADELSSLRQILRRFLHNH